MFLFQMIAVFWGMTLIGLFYLRFMAPVILLFFLVWSGLSLAYSPDEAFRFSIIVLGLPSLIALLAVVPFAFGSYFQIVSEVGVFMQRSGSFSIYRASTLVRQNYEDSLSWMPRAMRRLFGART